MCAGKFEQDLVFEVVGAQLQSPFVLRCDALCAVPQISTEPKVVFAKRAKTRKVRFVSRFSP